MNARGPHKGSTGAIQTPRGVTHREDLQLVQDALDGDPDARERLVPHLARVPAVVAKHRGRYRNALQAHDEADLVQDCLALVWRKLREYEGRAALSTWIWSLCSLELMNGFRRLQRGERGMPLAPESEALSDDRQSPSRQVLNLDLEDSLTRLTDDQQRVVRLRHFQGMTMDALAKEIGLPPSQAKVLYYRSIQRLHGFLSSGHLGEDER